ncbi:MAG TPA: DNA polymerase III subunit chi [Pseudomonadales bacterium]|nr:DNA polymerase III subunit chi [Pseudomonadales bacterium]
MTRVDFYILPDVDIEAQLRFACRLAHRAMSSGQRVHVHVDDAAASRDLDGLMWEYPEQRFLPHGIAGEPAAAKAPVIIDHREPADGHDELLINLSASIPPFFGRFERVAEIVVQKAREVGRDRYKYYRDRGYPLFHHELDQWEER